MIRIGELSKRTGIGTDALRAWERRYGLLDPVRSPAGYRLYSDEDERRVRDMRALIEEGLAASEAASVVRRRPPAPRSALDPGRAATRLVDAAAALDEPTANGILDEVLAAFTFDAVASQVVLPALREIGLRWSQGDLSAAQEHFASNLIRSRLLALARGWGGGSGPAAVLACVPGELHDIGLIVFGLALRERGWRISYLGSDVPVADVADVAERVDADLVVAIALDEALLERSAADLRSLADRHPLAIAGVVAGADAGGGAAEQAGARVVRGGPLEGARELAAAASA